MNTHRYFAAALLSAFAFQVCAQTATSNSSTSATSSSANQGNNQGITFNSDASGDSKIRNVPALGGNSFYGSFSSDNCMVSAGGGVTVVGFGANTVVPYRDEQCDLRRTFERIEQAAAAQPQNAARLHQAANDVLCMVSERVRAAMQYQGLCSPIDITTADNALERQTVREDREQQRRVAEVYTPG